MPITKDNVIFIYRSGDADSLSIAQKYQAARELDDNQLVSISCSKNEILADQNTFDNEVLNPIKDAIASSNRTVWVIVLGFNVPGGFSNGGDVISSVSRVSRLNHSLSKQTRNFLYNRSDFKRFDAIDANFALVVSRIDGPSVDVCENMISRATLLLKQKTVHGKFYVDPFAGLATKKSEDYQDEILDFTIRTLPTLNLPTFSTIFLDPYIDVVIPSVEDDSFVWSWFADRSSLSFFKGTNNIRTFFYNADFDGAATIKNINDRRWPVLALQSEYLSAAGAMSNPTIDGLLRPRPFFESLQKGANLGEAFLFSTPFVDWTMTLFGDPLVEFEFPAPETISGVDEDESWRLMSVDFATAISYMYRYEDAFERIQDSIVLSTDIRTEVDLLIPSVTLRNATTLDVVNSDIRPLVSEIFNYLDERQRFIDPANNFPSTNDFLEREGIDISHLISDVVTPLRPIADDHIFEQGEWIFDFTLEDDALKFVFYHFEMDVASDPLFTNILFNIDSKNDQTNWFFEKDVNEFVALPKDGVSSNFVTRRIRYESKKEEFLARTDKFYIRVRQREGDNLFDFRIFPEEIVNT
tara:strand:- start:153 stop:1898 length:1746 start_codon:yes stop_codon:yes gene_type:complete